MKTKRGSLPSPCVRNCCLDEGDICMGCFRHIDEIVRWGMADDAEQQEILEKSKQRQTCAGSRRQ
ncbi:MAG: DUF1289 domain-containing protein [Sulfuriflexus sp.]|nr:DUF1289 domain-containing protein [Sulfuriflexus sp.]